MKILKAKSSGFCAGVEKAVRLAEEYAAKGAYSVGDVIHNDYVMDGLKKKGLRVVADSGEIPDGGILLVRSHGLPEEAERAAAERGIEIIDGTCVFVKKIHDIVAEHYKNGYTIAIAGRADHPEVRAINSRANYSAVILEGPEDALGLPAGGKICLVAQTTYSTEKWAKIKAVLDSRSDILVEIFDTICYTTKSRQEETRKLAEISDKMLVVGGVNSSNTAKLLEISKGICRDTYLISNPSDLKNIVIKRSETVGITAGASTPDVLLTEVINCMAKALNTEPQSQEFIQGVEESFMVYRKGKFVKGEIISIDDQGLHINIGGKKDGLIPASEGSFQPDQYKVGDIVEAVISGDKAEGSIMLSKKMADDISEGNKVLDTVRDGQAFELTLEKAVKGGMLSKLGTYTVFVPASQLKSHYVSDLSAFEGKKMRVCILDIDDEKRKIVASALEVTKRERQEKEDAFWNAIEVDMIVNGKVKRITDFGAFVSVNGFDCLAHVTDLAWSRVNKVDDILTIGESYDFVILNFDREKNRVSLGYKQLQPKPWEVAEQKYPVDTVVKGKVVRIAPFGAFIELEPGIDALCHLSEISHSWIKNVSEVLHVGDEVDGRVIKNEDGGRKITISIKAMQEPPEIITLQEQIEKELAEEEASNPEAKETKKPSAKAKFEAREKLAAKEPRAPKKARADGDDSSVRQWSETASNNPFADLLKDLDLEEK